MSESRAIRTGDALATPTRISACHGARDDGGSVRLHHVKEDTRAHVATINARGKNRDCHLRFAVQNGLLECTHARVLADTIAREQSSGGGGVAQHGCPREFTPRVEHDVGGSTTVMILQECCVCLERPSGMVRTHCNHYLCRRCLLGWKAATCPCCRADISSERLNVMRGHEQRQSLLPPLLSCLIVFCIVILSVFECCGPSLDEGMCIMSNGHCISPSIGPVCRLFGLDFVVGRTCDGQCLSDVGCGEQPDSKCLSIACMNGTCTLVNKHDECAARWRPPTLPADASGSCDGRTGECRWQRLVDVNDVGEPSVSPPTLQCSADNECPTADKCHVGRCIGGICTPVATDCAAQRPDVIADDPRFTDGVCDPTTGICRYLPLN